MAGKLVELLPLGLGVKTPPTLGSPSYQLMAELPPVPVTVKLTPPRPSPSQMTSGLAPGGSGIVIISIKSWAST